MKRIFAIIAVSILAATAAGIDSYAAFDNNSSGAGTVTWAAQNVTSNTTVNLRSSLRNGQNTVLVQVTGTITVKSGATLTIKMSTSDTWTQRALIQVAGSFSGNCIFFVESGASLIIEGLSNSLFLGIKGSTLSSNLPAIYSDGTWTKPDISGLGGQMRWPAGYGMITTQGNVTMTHCRMYDAYSEADGAALVVRRNYTSNPINYGKVNLTDVRISNCVATFGPALVIYNQCPDAGTVFESTSTSVTPESSAVTLTDCTITNNYCTNAGNVCGVIRTGGGAYSHLKLKNTTISNNYANGEGGGIVWNAHGLSNYETVCTFDGCTIINNFAATAGAGMNMSASFEFINNKTTVSGNKTNTNGGGVYIPSYTGVTGLGQQTLNMFFNEYVSVENNTAENGGGVYVDMESTHLAEGSSVNLYFEEGTNISSNTATGNGGGIYYNGNSPKLYFNMYVNGGTFKSNTAVSGGGMYFLKGANMNASRTKLFFNGGEISSCTASENGGGVYVNGLNLQCVEKIEGEVGAEIYTNTAVSSGGGLYVDGGSVLTMYSGKIYGNSSTGDKAEGGGVFCTGGSTLNITGGVIGGEDAGAANKAYNGGGIFVDNSVLNMNSGVVSHNEAANNAGGIYVKGTSTVTFNNGTVSSNTSGTYGGGVYVGGCSSFSLVGGVVSSNEVTGNNGGGLHFSAGANNVTISGGTIEKNTAAGSGGGIATAVGLTFQEGVVISGNVANAHTGGGIYFNASESASNKSLVIYGGEVSGNECNQYGGGIAVYNGNISISGGKILNNVAKTLYGGGLHLAAGADEATISDGLISKNSSTSGNGGGVSISGGTCEISGGAISENSSILGGGIYQNGGTLAITGGDIISNEALNGGGVFVTGSEVTMSFTDGIIRNNEAKDASSRTLTTGYDYTVSGTALSLQGTGGGVFVQEGASFTIGGDAVGIYGNLAETMADDIYSNGKGGAKVVLPDVSSMDLSGYNSKTSELFWVEDYMTNDTGYASGTAIAGASHMAVRYRDAIASQSTVYKVPAGTYTNKYLALSIGHEIIYVTIVRSGLLRGENAVYRIFRWDDNDTPVDGSDDEWVTYSELLLYGPEDAEADNAASKSTSMRVALFSGRWMVQEIGWNWTYGAHSAIERDITGSSSAQEKSFYFSSAKKTVGEDGYIPAEQYSESVVTNDFGRGTVEVNKAAPASSSSFETIGENGVRW